MVKAISKPELRNSVRSVGGCETFSHREIAELAFQVLGKEPCIKTIKKFSLVKLPQELEISSQIQLFFIDKQRLKQ